MEHRVHTVVDSPVGTLTLVAADGVLTGLYMALQRHRPLEETFGARDRTPFTAVIRQLDHQSGPVSRRTVERAVGCGASRATRLMARARPAVDHDHRRRPPPPSSAPTPPSPSPRVAPYAQVSADAVTRQELESSSVPLPDLHRALHQRRAPNRYAHPLSPLRDLHGRNQDKM